MLNLQDITLKELREIANETGDPALLRHLDSAVEAIELTHGARRRLRMLRSLSPAEFPTAFLRDPNVDGCMECGGPANDPDAGIATHGDLVCGDCAAQDISIDCDDAR